MKSDQSAQPTLGDDLVWGARGVAKELKISERKAFYMIERHQIPVRHIGKLIVASKSKLREHLVEEQNPRPAT
jgi:hypothetical protein